MFLTFVTSDQWFNKNYSWICYWAKRWSPNDWRELVTQLWLYLTKSWSKFSQIPDNEERIKFIQTWYKNSVNWESSDYNKTLKVNNLDETWTIPDEPEDYYIEIIAETSREDLQEWLVDINRRFSDYDVDRLIKFRQIYLTLPTTEKVLYDLYFSQMMSMRDIAKKIDLPLSTIYNMLKDLKNKLKIECGLK